MKLKYRIQVATQFLSFAFYPRTTLLSCLAATIVIDLLLGWLMTRTVDGSGLYNVLFALITGATASFLVSIVVEMSSNYRHNLLAWQELQQYYSAVSQYESMKQVLLGNTAHQMAEKKAREDFLDDSGMLEEYDDLGESDLIQATWKQLPEIIPIMTETLERKKAFLSGDEIDELRDLVRNYKEIRYMVNSRIRRNLLYDTLNHPDEKFLVGIYPQNIIDNLPDWIKWSIASNESQKAIDAVTDAIMQDAFMLSRYMEDYDISQHAIDSYESKTDEELPESDVEDDLDEEDEEEEIAEDEAMFRARVEAMNEQMEVEDCPFVSWNISTSCSKIAHCIDELEKSIMKKPYVGWHIKMIKKSADKPWDSQWSKKAYANEKKAAGGRDASTGR